MAIIRIHSNEDYTAISNRHLRNTSLSWQAMGMLSFMLSCSEHFKFSIEGLTKCSGSGNAATRSALKELQDKGYVVVTRLSNERGQVIEWQYDIYEVPNLIANPDAENPHVGDGGQRYNNKSSIIIEENNSIRKNNNSNSIPPLPPKTKLDLSFIEDDYREAYMQWIEYKQAIKKEYKTQQSLEINYRRAKYLADNNPYIFRLIIEQSIGNGWIGLFALNPKSYGTPTNSNQGVTTTAAPQPQHGEKKYEYFDPSDL